MPQWYLIGANAMIPTTIFVGNGAHLRLSAAGLATNLASIAPATLFTTARSAEKTEA